MSKYKFTNKNNVPTYATINGRTGTKSSYQMWKRIQENTHADDRFIVHPDFLDWGSFEAWYKRSRPSDISACTLVSNCVGFDDFRIGPDTSAIVPRGVGVILYSKIHDNATRLERLRKAIAKHEAAFYRFPKIRQMLWNYRFESTQAATEVPEPAEAAETTTAVENPLKPIAKAIAEAIQFQYDQLSDDLLFQLYFDNQAVLVPAEMHIRIPGWPHRYPVVLELVRSIPAPPPVIKEPLTIEEQVAELTKDIRTANQSVDELDQRFDKLVEYIKPSMIVQAFKEIETLKGLINPDAIRSIVKDLQMVKISVRSLESQAQKLLNETPNTMLAQRMHQLENLVMEHITKPTGVKDLPQERNILDAKATPQDWQAAKSTASPAPKPSPIPESAPTPIAKALQTVTHPTPPEIVIVGLAPDVANRIITDYGNRINLTILPLNVNAKRLKAVCKNRHVILMTAFSSHSITNTIKAVTDNLVTVGNGVSSLTRVLDATINA